MLGIEASSLGSDQPHFSSGNQMISNYLDAVQTIQSANNYILVGWSYGALIAFQMANQLIAQGAKIKGFIIIDSASQKDASIRKIEKYISVNSDNPYNEENLKKLVLYYQEFLKCNVDSNDPIKVQLYKLLGNPECHDNRVLDRFNKMVMNHILCSQNFTSNICNIKESVLIKAVSTQYENEVGCWDKLIKGSILTHTIPGDHYSIMESNQLANILSNYILRWI